MVELSPDKSGYNTKHTPKQKLLLSLVWKNSGDTIAAAKEAGYSDPYQAVDSLQKELAEMAEKAFARLSMKGVDAIGKILDSNIKDPDSVVVQASEKLKAVQLLWDRTHPKTEKIDITAEHKGGVFVLPDKRPVEDEHGEQD